MRIEANTRLRSFPPLVGPAPRVLILGSMPGVASLQANQYYAHPRNRFWPLMAALLNEPLPADYPARCALLMHHGIALWDVLAECERPGSLDSAIRTDSQRPNAITALLVDHPGIRTVITNGGHAARTLTRYVPDLPSHVTVHSCPSTSPANARWTREQLAECWGEVLRPAVSSHLHPAP
ncbi:MAG: DNA-deoxyinosine glycosylase [Oceanococcaceae bacterium]